MGHVTVLAVTGLNREARIVAGPGVVTLASGGDIATLAARIEAALTPDIAGIISIGIAGALDPSLRVGDIVVGVQVVVGGAAPSTMLRMVPLPRFAGEEMTRVVLSPPPPARERDREAVEGAARHWPMNREWTDALLAKVAGVRRGRLAGSDHMLVDAVAKAALHQSTGALCVDMESHIAAAVAARRGLPFAAVRVISDGADRALPKAAQAGMKPNGGMDIGAVLKSLAADPRQLPALIRTGIEAELAFNALAAACRQLGPGFVYNSASS